MWRSMVARAVIHTLATCEWVKNGYPLCAAIVDRLTFNATIIETGTQSYRLSQTRAQQVAT
jgi:hypothetical protein